MNAPLVDATSSIDERFFKSPIDKALGSGFCPPAGAAELAVGAFAVALVGLFNVFFLLPFVIFLLIAISI